MNAIVRVGAILMITAAAATPATAQSLFATRGLGVPVYPVDARAAALGGIGVGIIGFHTSVVNPAELAGLTRRGVSAALQPISTSVDVEGVEDGTSGTRFPLVTVLYPVSPRLVMSLGYGGYLDQTWGVITRSEQDLNGEPTEIIDQLRSTGGISQLRLSGAWSFSPTFALGAAVGLMAGNVDRVAVRTFGDSANVIQPFDQRVRWRYSAPIAVLGFRWDPVSRLRLGASAMIGTDLEASNDEEDLPDVEYGSPLELAAGASYRLTSLLMATAGATWSRVPSPPTTTVSDETVRVGGGLEYQGLRSGLRTYPVRVGVRWAQLPYRLPDESRPTEWGAALGLGFRIGDPMDPAAVADFSIERGARTGLESTTITDGVEEQLWRVTFSLSLFAR